MLSTGPESSLQWALERRSTYLLPPEKALAQRLWTVGKSAMVHGLEISQRSELYGHLIRVLKFDLRGQWKRKGSLTRF